MSFENPYLPDEFERMRDSMLPPDSTGREKQKLTLIQQIAFPILMWFFDSRRNIGTGRSYLMAWICIEMAKRGYKVNIDDLSNGILSDSYKLRTELFLRILDKVIKDHYPLDLFKISNMNKTLEYQGRRPE